MALRPRRDPPPAVEPAARGPVRGRPRAQNADRHVGAKMRERRVMLGLTQAQLAERIGVTWQQGHKYETGLNRLSAGRLYQVAQALGVEVGYFFEGLEQPRPAGLPPPQRQLLELARHFVGLPRRQQEALCTFARALAGEVAGDGEPEAEAEGEPQHAT
jgi:transcriptional regulator with XRE-family HTH domain